ncbi:MAG: hypothetical protein JJ871_06205 [Thalassospira sp.]|jgi:hypothetical protein|uniref:tectonin domain-containing protein n=1 Tax=unclassified Thalassospira TaxID=2648997 RepID=UPI0007A629E8|nr:MULTISPECIES: tectonin domain-containing protein [unclassified Thalassospira]KZD01920.1 hypothetical protein AUQ41_00140 [Thalassospira sp. MCCC 1A02898]MBO6580018.1 hypothetical protein [Thalassospira sp.]MBO6803248.1 hypothetical protein [Thalassospira sp.]MBO6820476.1 hypothetical protein [Thalassospira sp.]MBO6887643.1 hypothetical protein [Thalassospira sp.]
MKLKIMSKARIGGLFVAASALIYPYVDAHGVEQNIEIIGDTGGGQSIESLENQGAGGNANAQNANLLPGKAHDIAVDKLGNRYAVGSQKGMNGYALYKWAANSAAWQKMNGEAVRITARPKQAWIVNTQGQVFYESGPTWRNVPAPIAKDISAGRDTVWITTPNDEIFRYVPQGTLEFVASQDQLAFNNGVGGWARVNVNAVKVELDDSDNPWIIDKSGQLNRFHAGKWRAINAPKAIDLNASEPGNVEFVDEKGDVLQYEVTTNRWWYLSQSKDTVAIGGSSGELLKLSKNLDIFKVR